MRRLIGWAMLFVGVLGCGFGMEAARAGDGGIEQGSVRTVISGRAVLEDGSPDSGATVTLMSHGGSAVAEADGSFEIEAMVPSVAAEVSVSALLDRGDRRLVGTATRVRVDGGEFAAGVVVMRDSCEAQWSELVGPGGNGANNTVFALTVFDDGTGPALYAAGSFTTAGGVTVNRIARWDGSAWSGLIGPGGTGVSSNVYALAVFDDGTGPALYVAGSFIAAGGVFVNQIARWDGSSWSALNGPDGNGMDSIVFALTVFDDGRGPALYAGGFFTTAGGVTVNRIARWDGSSWSALTGPGGTGVNFTVRALKVFDDGSGPALYVGGKFTEAGGAPIAGIARWNGSSWSGLSGVDGTEVGVNGPVFALTVFDDGTGPSLYAGGIFNKADEMTVNGIARWNGSSWSPLSDAGGTGMSDAVLALTVFDDGREPSLYAGGSFINAGGVIANRVARWDGSSWSALAGQDGTGVDSTVLALTVFDDGTGPALHVGGDFTTAGDLASNRIAKWSACVVDPVPCVSDLNGDGVVDTSDLGALLGAFGVSAAGDVDGDGVTDADDLGVLLAVFGSVCE